MVDDGSKDQSWAFIEQASARSPYIRGIKFRRNYGKSAALHCGFQCAQGQVVITMDADMQDSPDEIPELFRMITAENYDMVSGWKKKRYDPLSKTLPTKLFNATARKFSGIYLHDFNCGLKAYKQQVVKKIETPQVDETPIIKSMDDETIEIRSKLRGSFMAIQSLICYYQSSKFVDYLKMILMQNQGNIQIVKYNKR